MLPWSTLACFFLGLLALNDAVVSGFVASPGPRLAARAGAAVSHGGAALALRPASAGLQRRRPRGAASACCQLKPGDSPTSVSAPQYLWFLGILPLLSIGFVPLFEAASTAIVPEDRRALIILLLILKRVYIYCVALSCVDVAARRSFTSSEGLGERLKGLNDEILGEYVPETENEKQAATAAYKALDEVDTGAQAVLLPLFFAATLATSFFFLSLGASAPPPTDPGPNPLGDLMRPLVSVLPVLSSAAVCILFTRVELAEAIKTFFPQSGKQTDGGDKEGEGMEASGTASFAAAAALVAACFVGPSAWVWPLKNLVNSCLAVTAARAIQIPKFKYVALALSLLVGYDVISVYGTGALVAPASAAQEAASSVMETVARSKLQGGGFWQPGLLEVVVNGKTTDALGLGDVVVPSMLAGWAMREDGKLALKSQDGYDQEAAAARGPISGAYSSAALGGYAAGCFLCEVFNSGGGQPALLFIIPPMLLMSLSVAGFRGDLSRLLRE